jgi:hypothetical protein
VLLTESKEELKLEDGIEIWTLDMHSVDIGDGCRHITHVFSDESKETVFD